MTSEELRLLDMEIAIRVFGYAEGPVGPDYNGEHRGTTLRPPDFPVQYFVYPPVGPIPLAYHVPDYSKQAVLAFSLLENPGIAYWEIRKDRDADAERQYSCLVIHPRWQSAGHGAGETKEIAICRAILEAVRARRDVRSSQ